jgi:hypothetical protein
VGLYGGVGRSGVGESGESFGPAGFQKISELADRGISGLWRQPIPLRSMMPLLPLRVTGRAGKEVTPPHPKG